MKPLICLALPVALLGLPAAAPAAEPLAVKDGGRFFSPEALNQANAAIEDILRRYNKELAIETYKEIPGDRKDEYEPDKKATFFEVWARERAAALSLNGIIVLVCRDPRYIEIGVGRKMRQKAFTPADRKRLLQMMRARFRNNEYDEGLLEGVAFVRATLQKNLGGGRGP